MHPADTAPSIQTRRMSFEASLHVVRRVTRLWPRPIVGWAR
jgi:hypothetical protein